MTREEAIECIEAIHVQMFNSGNSKWTKACDMAIEALKNIQVIDKIPQNYLYDTETEHCLVYRHKYTGKEIHILKPTDLLVLERPHGKWEYLKEHIIDMCDADGKANQTETCQFILNLMGVIEREGEKNE